MGRTKKQEPPAPETIKDLSPPTIWRFSDYQIGYLRSLFYYEDAPKPHDTKIEAIGYISTGELIVSITKYGRSETKHIPRNNPELLSSL